MVIAKFMGVKKVPEECRLCEVCGVWGECPVVGDNLHRVTQSGEIPYGWKHGGCTLKEVRKDRFVGACDAYRRIEKAAKDGMVSLAEVRKILLEMPAALGE